MQSGTTIDLVWVNQRADDLLVACPVDTNNNFNHHSDHQALVTGVRINHDNVATSETNHTSQHNWHKFDHRKFLTELKALLPPLRHQLRKTDITIADSHILEAVTRALNKSSPATLKTHRHKYCWNPKTMAPLQKEAKRARRVARSYPNDKNKETYCSAHDKYLHFLKFKRTNS